MTITNDKEFKVFKDYNSNFQDLTQFDLDGLNSANLKILAKESKVKNWWKLKKANLVTELKALQSEQNLETSKEDSKESQKEDPIKQEQPSPKIPEKDEKKEPKEKSPKKQRKVDKDEENLTTLKELASEFKMKSTKVRRLLRNAKVTRPYGGNRWEWDNDLHKDILIQIRELLEKHSK